MNGLAFFLRKPMRERFNFVGKNLNPQEEASAAYSIASKRKERNVFYAEELEKTSGEVKAIELADSLLKGEFLDLEIAEVPELRPERFHIMSDEWFKKNIVQSTIAFYASFEDKAAFSRERAGSSLDLYTTILHEGIHAVSHQKHWVDVEKRKVSEYRVGYGVTNTATPEKKDVHLNAFNEGVTEMTVQELFQSNQKRIKRELSISEEAIAGIKFSYAHFRAVVTEIVYGVAKHKAEEAKEVWKRIKRGQFTGDMMHLRDIEYAYGKGALRVLNALRMIPGEMVKDSKDDASITGRNDKILQYFESYDRGEERKEEVRQELAKEILGEEAYKRYCL